MNKRQRKKAGIIWKGRTLFNPNHAYLFQHGGDMIGKSRLRDYQQDGINALIGKTGTPKIATIPIGLGKTPNPLLLSHKK